MKPKILMLGWEYPPEVNGGLGVAFSGLVKALTPFADITVIVPKAEEHDSTQFPRTVSLEKVKISQLVRRQLSPDLAYVPQIEQLYSQSKLNPYELPAEKERLGPDEKQELEHWPSESSEFVLEELYGEGTMPKVFQYSRLAVRVALQHEFDLIHAHDWMSFLAGLEIKQLTGKPLIVHIHSLERDRSLQEKEGVAYQIELQAMLAADKVVAVSHFTEKCIIESYGIDPEKIQVVYNGLFPIPYALKKKHFDEKLVVFAGRLTQQKAPMTFVDIAGALIESGHNIRCAIAGDGDLAEQLMREVAQRKLGHKIHFLGFLPREQLFELFSIADVVLAPSVSEPFGLVALEATYCQVPVVMTKQSGVAELFQNAKVADHWDTTVLKNHVEFYLKNPDAGTKAVNQNRKQIDFEWKHAVKEMLQIYSGLLL